VTTRTECRSLQSPHREIAKAHLELWLVRMKSNHQSSSSRDAGLCRIAENILEQLPRGHELQRRLTLAFPEARCPTFVKLSRQIDLQSRLMFRPATRLTFELSALGPRRGSKLSISASAVKMATTTDVSTTIRSAIRFRHSPTFHQHFCDLERAVSPRPSPFWLASICALVSDGQFTQATFRA
jgi:hypothetical protein